MPILRRAISRRADGPSIVGRPDPGGSGHGSGARRMTDDMQIRCHVESRSGPALYVHFRAAVGCLAGLVRLVSADVRDAIDVIAWLAPLPFQGMEFGI